MALKRFLLVLWLAGCGPGHQSANEVSVDVSFDEASSDYGIVNISGTRDTSRLAVFVSLDSALSATPKLSGRWERKAGSIRFVPSFRPSPGTTIWVHLARIARDGSDRSPERVWRFAVPANGESTAARIVALHPSMDSLPENTLRWYIEFSKPMRPGSALAHVSLVDAQGRVDRTAFLDTSEELWDPTYTRLTLLFDPGRVKRGVRTNLEQGRPLKAGERYTLVIEPGWPDMSGGVTDVRFEKKFVATTADHAGPKPEKWLVSASEANTRDPVVLSLDDAVDHALGMRLIAVTDVEGNPVSGASELRQRDREWRFTPDEPWEPGTYRIQVANELEDVAGNRPGLAFDHVAGEAAGAPQSRKAIVRSFEIMSPGR